MRPPRVFTVPPGLDFLGTLAESLLDGRLVGPLGGDPLSLAAVTVYLPTRRAARALGHVLADRHGGGALLLPRLVALGEADEAEFDLAGTDAADVTRPPIPPLERRLMLARLAQAWAGHVDRALLPLGPEVPFLVPGSPADAVGLAADLERLMDALTHEDLPWSEIAGAVEAEHSRYFGLTLDFLRIAAEAWPGILAERGVSDPVARQRELVRAEAARLAGTDVPVIVAGSTGSLPATAALIRAVAGLPRGAVILPGLDQGLDEAAWASLGTGHDEAAADPAHGHPQTILHRLLAGLELARAAVVPLGTPDSGAQARTALLSQALRPAETTDAWAAVPAQTRVQLAAQGGAGIAVVEAADEREEALCAALALREALEVPGRTAMLVTPDRGLAARVAAELARWGIAAEDSAGAPLATAPAGRLARLVAEVAAGDAAPARVLALLAHPMVRLGRERASLARAAAALEIGTLRGPPPGPGFRGLAQAVAGTMPESGDAAPRRAPLPRRRLVEADWAAAHALVADLAAAFAGFAPDPNDPDGVRDLVALAEAHRGVCEALLAGPEDVGEGAEDAEETGAEPSLDVLDALFDDLALAASGGMPGRFADYPGFFAGLARERVVAAEAKAAHPRLRILGLIEARLMNADRVVLGGLDEAVWPPAATGDAFLNRPMRGRIGLSAPERRIGQAAHDFVELLGVRDAIVTRASKREQAPTVPSRFLQRLRAFAGEAAWTELVARGSRYRALAAALDAPETPVRAAIARPAPRPDPKLFPAVLSVTEVETLVRDPYVVFARRILRLDPLEAVAVVPGASERGTLVHAVLGGFAGDCPQALPPDARERLSQRAADTFGPLRDIYPELHAQWWPRFERVMEPFLAWEAERRPHLVRVHAEASGRWEIALRDGGLLALTARADRIEHGRDGSYAIVDYKTGTPPGHAEVFAGFSPQLTLEAAMLMHGAFKGLPATPAVPALLYVRVSGGKEPMEPRAVAQPRGEARTLDALVAEHAARLKDLAERFRAGEAAYVSRPYPKYVAYDSPYDHLARVREWSLAAAGDEAP